MIGYRPQPVQLLFLYNVSMMTIQNTSLYNALLQRTSVRRYQKEPLSAGILDRVRELPRSVIPLVPDNDFHVTFRDDMRVDRNMLRSFGAYGAIVNPPHALIPYIIGKRHPLLDWGFRTQQLMIAITQLGLGSCYIGVVGRQASVRRRLNLPGDAHLGAFLIFGKPLRTIADPAAKRKRLSFPDFFFNGSFDQPAHPPEDLLPILAAAQAAPSAVNTQPWRFLWQEPWLHLFVKRNNRSYLSHANQPYRHVDGGIVMANISLTLQALNMSAPWSFATTLPPYPPELEHLASIALRA